MPGADWISVGVAALRTEASLIDMLQLPSGREKVSLLQALQL